MSDTPAPDTETAEGAAAAPTSSWPAPSAADRRRWHIQDTLTNLVVREVTEELGPDGVGYGPDPGFAKYGNRPQPDPLAAVRVARTIRREAAQLLGEHIDRARGAGHTWTDLAAALGLTKLADEAGIPVDEAAFCWATTGRIDGDRGPFSGYEPRRSWRCASCQERVSDHGPFNGNPDDDETGHAPGCARHTAELAAWQTRNDAWDDGDGDDGDGDDGDGDR
ncbi:MAG: hypothetical protein QOC93_859 [Actinomycetota bacterium]|jgi:hypothetical protein|nr:hypothetical protein [Actinomycetota bacterium]